jgi:hypothetical protein
MAWPRIFWLFAGVLWIVLLALGWHALLRYERTAGDTGGVPEHWPANSTLPLDPEKPTLVLFAHRNCPCTRIGLQELEYILTKAPGSARVLLVLLAPTEAAADRVGGDIEKQARSLPGAEVVLDADGVEAQCFRVRTSGHVVLYSADGGLLFSGGITDGRGHAGDNAGRRAVLALLRKEETGQRTAPVYGCSLFAEEGE